MPDIETDFCVVGAGPAGLTLALLLLRSGARVAVIEKSRSLEREYRGEILQPGGMAVLDQLGVLERARKRGAHEHDRFHLVDRGRVLIDSDYRTLPGPFPHLLSIPQQHVLKELLADCRGFPGFTFIEGSRVTGLIEDEGTVVGARCAGRGGDHHVHSHCTIGADGRYSRVRRLAGIDAGRDDVFDHDILWFKLPAHGNPPRDVRILRAGGSPVLSYASHPDDIQIGWTVPHKRYRELVEQGDQRIRESLASAIPEHGDAIRARISGIRDLTLLDVFAGCAPEWTRDGLVLIGDSAHTHSPIGAQGINLAVQDAAVLHPILLKSLHARDARAALLEEFTRARKPDIDRIMRVQVMQSKAMLSASGPASVIRPLMAGVMSRTPLFQKIFRLIAFGNPGIRVSSEHFADGPGAAG